MAQNINNPMAASLVNESLCRGLWSLQSPDLNPCEFYTRHAARRSLVEQSILFVGTLRKYSVS
jgi:hypothetical protein